MALTSNAKIVFSLALTGATAALFAVVTVQPKIMGVSLLMVLCATILRVWGGAPMIEGVDPEMYAARKKGALESMKWERERMKLHPEKMDRANSPLSAFGTTGFDEEYANDLGQFGDLAGQTAYEHGTGNAAWQTPERMGRSAK